MKRTILICMLILGFYHPDYVVAQNPFSRLKMEHWDTKKGMPNDMVLNVYQTMDGYIWTTGYTGLTRFDGINFTPFNSRTVPLMKTDNIEALLYETSDSALWIPTTNSGLLSYKNGQFKSYLSDSTSLYIYGKTENDELLIYIGRRDRSYILFDTHKKEYKSLTDVQRIELLKNNDIISYERIIDKSGNVWLGFNGVLYYYRNGKLNEITSIEGLPEDRRYYDVYADSKNRVWVTSTHGLFLWNGRKFELYPGMEESSFVSSGAISTGRLFEDSNGGLWAATATGIAYLPAHANRFLFYPGEDDLLSQAVNNITEDREGNLWFSSTANGLIKLSESKFIGYSVRDGLNANRIAAVCAQDTNSYLLATYLKLYQIKKGEVEPYSFRNKNLENFDGDPTHLFKDSNHNVWLSFTSGKVIKISSKNEKLYKSEGLIQARYVFEDETGKIWFGFAYSGIGFINQNDEIELLDFPNVDFSSYYISSVRKLKNGNWLITSFTHGIIIIDQQGIPTYYDDKSGLPTIGIFSSAEDPDGTVWLTTQAGITRFKNDEFRHIDFKSGLPENSIFEFIPDRKGYVWFPSNRGLIRAYKQELNDYLDKKSDTIQWQLYDDGDGMLNRQCIGARHAAIAPDGKLLFPTFGGLVEVDPAQLKKNPIAPAVNIHQALRDDVDLGLGQNQTFTPGDHRYIFGYSALSFVAPEKAKFKFKLEGYDKDWVTAVGDRKAFYTNLSSGDYTFRVIACNNDEVWNTTGASYSFSIAPFFHQTFQFRMLVLVVFSLLIWGLIKWRTRATRKQNEILESQVASRTSELNAANTELNHSLDNLKATQFQLIQSEKMASLGELTAGIAHEIQNPLNFVNNFSEVNAELIEELKGERSKVKGERDDKLEEEILNDLEENENKIKHHGHRASGIVKGMLEHSRSGDGEKEPTDLNALADEYLRLAYHGLRAKDNSFNADFKTDFDPSLPKVEVIPQDIGRVLLNLINNAFYAVDKKAKDGIQDYKPEVLVSTKLSPFEGGVRGVNITVSDNGGGIPEQVRDKIFQPFFTTKPTGSGTGLGLSLSYDIVKAHGGEISVDSTEKTGTKFTIIIPINS